MLLSPTKARLFLGLGALSGFVGVALGAFGAHALRDCLSPDSLEVFHTGVRYQMFHAFALLAAGLVAERSRGRAAPAAGWFFAFGTVVFSGSLYALAFTGVSRWGAVTPIGGAAWLAGWLLLAASSLRPRTLVAHADEIVVTAEREDD